MMVPVAVAMSTSLSPTLVQSKHWSSAPRTSPMVRIARFSPGHLRLPIPNGIMNFPSALPSSNRSGLNSSGLRVLPHRRVPVDGVRIDEDHRPRRDVVPVDLAVGGRLVRQQHRRGRVEAKSLADDAVEVGQAGEVVLVDKTIPSDVRLDLFLRPFQHVWVVKQERHCPFQSRRGRLRAGGQQILQTRYEETVLVKESMAISCSIEVELLMTWEYA